MLGVVAAISFFFSCSLLYYLLWFVNYIRLCLLYTASCKVYFPLSLTLSLAHLVFLSRSPCLICSYFASLFAVQILIDKTINFGKNRFHQRLTTSRLIEAHNNNIKNTSNRHNKEIKIEQNEMKQKIHWIFLFKSSHAHTCIRTHTRIRYTLTPNWDEKKNVNVECASCTPLVVCGIMRKILSELTRAIFVEDWMVWTVRCMAIAPTDNPSSACFLCCVIRLRLCMWCA